MALHILQSNSKFWVGQELKSYPQPIYVDSILFKLSTSSGLFIKENNCFYSVDDNAFIQNKQSWDKADKSDNTYIVILTTIDKRSSFYKTYKSRIKELKEDFNKATEILSKNFNLSKVNILSVLEYYNSVDQAILELDKAQRLGLDESVNSLVDKGVISPTKNLDIFRYSKEIGYKNKVEFIKSLKDWDNQNIIPLLTIIFNDFKIALQLKSCTVYNAYKVGGINQWDCKRVSSFGNPYNRNQLLELIQLCVDLDKDIKFGNLTTEEASIYLFSQILSK